MKYIGETVLQFDLSGQKLAWWDLKIGLYRLVMQVFLFALSTLLPTAAALTVVVAQQIAAQWYALRHLVARPFEVTVLADESFESNSHLSLAAIPRRWSAASCASPPRKKRCSLNNYRGGQLRGDILRNPVTTQLYHSQLNREK
jgi:hypothetical protein